MPSKRNDFDDFFEDDEPEKVIDTRADGRLMRVPLARISPNRVNPRTHFGAPEELEELGNSLRRRQIQAVPVVSRAAYLKLWPDHAQQVGNVDVVIVSGERRYRAATTVELPALEVVLNDEVAESRKTFMDAVVSENVDRQNFDPIEEALAVEALVEAFGTGRDVAQHFKRADGWVSQRRILLHLAPEVQELVRARTLPVEPARKLAKLARDGQWSAERQLAWWQEQQEQRTRAAAERKAGKQRPVEAESFTAVKEEPRGAPSGVPAPSSEVPAAPPLDRSPTVPAPAGPATPPPPAPAKPSTALSAPVVTAPPVASREPSSGPGRAVEEREPLPELLTVGAVPWGDLPTVAQILTERVSGVGRVELLELLARRWGGELSAEDRRRLAKLLGDD